MNQYKTLPPLSDAAVKDLAAIASVVEFKDSSSHRRRIGVNKFNRLSVYKYSRYLTWDASTREKFFATFPSEVISKSVVCWFLQIPKETGFLDRLETWKNEKSPSWITAYVVSGTGTLILNDNMVKMNEGCGVTFPLSLPHEIPLTPDGAIWACSMTFDNVWMNNDN